MEVNRKVNQSQAKHLLIAGVMFFAWLSAVKPSARAADFYVSPGGSGGSCSIAAPCSLNNGITNAQSGDTVHLQNGFYGDLNISNARNSANITITAQAGHKPELRRVDIRNSSRWIISHLTISPELAPTYNAEYLLHIRSDSSEIRFEDNLLYFTQDSSNWTAADWNSRPARYTIHLQGSSSFIRNNHLENVNFGIVVTGTNNIVEGNTIKNIGGDGIVVTADNSTIQYNTIKNFYKINDNHDDAIQFHRGASNAPIYNAIVRGNLIIGQEPGETNPLLGSPQGIACFANGMPIGWLIENNVVLIQHYHGISIYGARDTTIVNNIVFDPTLNYSIWISLNNQGQNTVVRNNMARTYTIGGTNVTADHNIDTDDYAPDALFVDYRNYNVKHRGNSPAIDTGSSELAPQLDIEGVRRPRGAGIDIGAYEYSDSSVLYGDVSGNGGISAYDASLTAQAAVDLIELSAEQSTAADVTGNGSISATDASWIAQKAIDPGVVFPVED